MTFSERAVEAAAEALSKLPIRDNIARGGELDRLRLSEAAKAALTAALAVDGLALVPKEPTLQQHIAAMEFALAHMKAHGVTSLSPFKDYPPLRETTAGMYRAMLTAASDGEVG